MRARSPLPCELALSNSPPSGSSAAYIWQRHHLRSLLHSHRARDRPRPCEPIDPMVPKRAIARPTRQGDRGTDPR